MAPNLTAIDWGTTSFRAYVIDEGGNVLQMSTGKEGILSVKGGAFEQVLMSHLERLPDWSRGMPIIAAGMITSRHGWRETPYIQCPAGARDLAEKLLPLDSVSCGKIWFVPGVSQLLPEPDIMRGEESQLAGIQTTEDLVAIMPGTHSKWVHVKDQAIVRFKTFMTGELFAILMKHSILGSVPGSKWNDKAFKKGVRHGFSGGNKGSFLLSGLFQIRVKAILGQAALENTSSHVSGLLIGNEIAEAVRSGLNNSCAKLIIGAGQVAEMYLIALSECGIDAEIAAEDTSARGLYCIARHKKLI